MLKHQKSPDWEVTLIIFDLLVNATMIIIVLMVVNDYQKLNDVHVSSLALIDSH